MKQTASAVPGLERGIRILEHLADHPGTSLEQLAREMGYPKASTFRILGTLESMNILERREDRGYVAVRRLSLPGNSNEEWEAKIGRLLKVLVEDSGSSAEWYEETGEGMVLRRQIHPPGPVEVRATPGFLRSWTVELDAVAALGFAFSKQAPPIPKEMEVYIKNGYRKKIPRDRIKNRIRLAFEKGVVGDEVFNTFGIRRAAAAVLYPSRFAVVSLAQRFQFGKETTIDSLCQCLKKHLQDHFSAI